MDSEGVIYIQEASAGDFQAIRNIGPAKASKLLWLREVQGFLDLSDLVKITGISQEEWETLVSEGKVIIKGRSVATTKQLSDKITQLETDRMQLTADNQRWQETYRHLRSQMEEKDKMWQDRLEDFKCRTPYDQNMTQKENFDSPQNIGSATATSSGSGYYGQPFSYSSIPPPGPTSSGSGYGQSFSGSGYYGQPFSYSSIPPPGVGVEPATSTTFQRFPGNYKHMTTSTSTNMAPIFTTSTPVPMTTAMSLTPPNESYSFNRANTSAYNYDNTY